MSGPLGAADAAALSACLAGGGVAVFPADTVYGLCCDPDDAAAARRIYELKGRPPQRPAAVMFFSLAPALRALGELEPLEHAALQVLMPGPVTVLLENRERLYEPACGPDPATLGVRVPLLGPAAAALAQVGLAVLQTSANLSGGPDARVLGDVPLPLRRGADLVLDGGELPGTPSTVIDLRAFAAEGRWAVLREGALGSARAGELLASLLTGGAGARP